jgi:outer membrane protein insertion porin family
MKKIACFIILITQFICTAVWAQQSFVVKSIRFEGLQRISQQTAQSYLPIKRGQVLSMDKTPAILRSLHQTGFFDQITLSRSGNTLIIHVDERPTIGQLKISGNSIIPTDKLTTVMRSMDVAEGRVYNPAVLDKIRQSLLNQYYQLGRYNARVDVNVTPLPRNRVMVNIDISEGLVAKVRRISIIGNHVFSERTLVNEMDLTTTGYITFFTQTDRYSEEKLDSSVDKIRSYYMDRGYLKFEVKSAQAEITPDRKSIYITVVISEGERYTVSSVDVTGDQIIPRDEIMKYVRVKPNTTFSRKQVMDSQKAISQAYGNKGYMFASVSVHPSVNDAAHTVALAFDVHAGKRAYVRQVTFSDNVRTNDIVLRREIQQLEGAPAATSRMEDSKQRLLMLPYIKDADMSVKPVPGVEDQVDVNYKVKEESSAQASAKLGYSQAYGLIVGAGVNQKNFLGTGNTLGLNFNANRYQKFFGIDYSNPYYTEEGISRSISFSVSRVNPQGAGVGVGAYTTNAYSLGVLYGIPLGQEALARTRLAVGLSYQNLLVNLKNGVSNQIITFVNEHSRHSQEADIKIGLARDTRNRAIFPTRGTIQSLFLDTFVPLDKGSVGFYTLNYAGKSYQPIWEDKFILLGKANLGYGNAFNGSRNFPFFSNYYAGGIDSVRGYQNYSLGPKDSNGKPFGGNVLADASLGLIFPNYISDNLRTTLFVDAGNVYTTADNLVYGGLSTMTGPLRYSVGIEADLLTPFGPIELSLAKPFLHKGDQSEAFQFSLGANF